MLRARSLIGVEVAKLTAKYVTTMICGSIDLSENPIIKFINLGVFWEFRSVS